MSDATQMTSRDDDRDSLFLFHISFAAAKTAKTDRCAIMQSIDIGLFFFL